MLAKRGSPRDGPLFKLSHNAFHGKEELPQFQVLWRQEDEVQLAAGAFYL